MKKSNAILRRDVITEQNKTKKRCNKKIDLIKRDEIKEV